jgi:hypothetical protein
VDERDFELLGVGHGDGVGDKQQHHTVATHTEQQLQSWCVVSPGCGPQQIREGHVAGELRLLLLFWIFILHLISYCSFFFVLYLTNPSPPFGELIRGSAKIGGFFWISCDTRLCFGVCSPFLFVCLYVPSTIILVL